MRLVSFLAPHLRVGAVTSDDLVVDLRAAYELWLLEVERRPDAEQLATVGVPADLARVAAAWLGRESELEAIVAHVAAGGSPRQTWLRQAGVVVERARLRLLPPVLSPTVLAVGSAYADHARRVAEHGIANTVSSGETGVKLSFFKPSSALLAHGEPLRYPASSAAWDFEAELAVVMGRTCREAGPEEALSCVFGFTILNDASVRDVPAGLGGFTSPRGKGGDTLAPLGPWVVPAATLDGDCDDLRIRTWVNGELRQDARTSDLLWPVGQIVSEASQLMTLHPGDVVATGTPSGVGLEDGRYLSTGDVVRIEIEGIGTLENPVGPPRGA